jgi:pilus assembly protein Flp/PilA
MLKLYAWFTTRMYALREDTERGAAAVEYGLLVALIALAVVVAVYWLGQKTTGIFCEVVSKLPFGPNDCTAAIPTP